MLADAIRNFPKQFTFQPVIENADKLVHASKFVVCGMGGSNHATDIFTAWRPDRDGVVHRDYGLPYIADLHERLIVCCSYSGNTEETIDALQEAIDRGLSVAAVAKGGRLIELARQHGVPHIVLPEVGIQPRSATGYMFVSLIALLQDEWDMQETRPLSALLTATTGYETGERVATFLQGAVPVVYASRRNAAVANNWKIKMNENAKIPCFANIFPELNHNEMNGLETNASTKKIQEPLRFVFLTDDEDHPRVQKRMQITADLYRDRGVQVSVVPLVGSSHLEKMFSSLMVADWATLALAREYNIDPEPVAMVEEFKKLME